MVAEARRRFPDGTYEVGDLRRLMRPTTSSGWAAVLAWYSLIHLAASELPEAVAALVRPLRADGWLVLGLHTGAEVRHVDEWFDHEVDLDFVLHDPVAIRALVEQAGLVDVEWYHRGPIGARGRDHRTALRDRSQAGLRQAYAATSPKEMAVRVLFSSTSGAGHVFPMLPLARAFLDRGA